MEKMLVRNFGPITSGYESDNGYMTINKFTVFIGEQGSGKSTIAKLYSTFAWLEKAFVCGIGNFDIDSFTGEDFIDICANQNLKEYFHHDTELKYIGDACEFCFSENKFFVTQKKESVQNYFRPKIMYIPSERNILSVVENADKIENLPLMLSLLQEEFDKAKNENTAFHNLPVNGFKFYYDKSSGTSYIKTENVSVRLASASSGLQSLAPVSVVTQYLAKNISTDIPMTIQKLSKSDREKIKSFIHKVYADDKNFENNLIDAFDLYFKVGAKFVDTNEYGKALVSVLRYYFNEGLTNIVEEPEQNLYPDSQVAILAELVVHANNLKKNRLIISTHSPYILSAINNYIFAADIFKKNGKKIDDVPTSLMISIGDISVYKTTVDGKIIDIKDKENCLIDASAIDDCSSSINKVYEKLMKEEMGG